MAFSTFEGYIHVSTPGAVLFQSHYWEAPLWFPRSQSFMVFDPDATEVTISVRDWLCGKKQLREFTMYTLAEIEAMSG